MAETCLASPVHDIWGNTSNATLGGFTGCRAGHTGVLCGKCLPGFGMSAGGLCNACAETDGKLDLSALYPVFFGLALAAVIGAMVLVFRNKITSDHMKALGSIQDAVDDVGDQMVHTAASRSKMVDAQIRKRKTLLLKQRRASGVEVTEEEAEAAAAAEVTKELHTNRGMGVMIKLKILVGLCQVVTQLMSSLEVEWPRDLLDVSANMNVVNLDVFATPSIRCLNPDMNYFSTLITFILAPTGFVGLMAVVAVLGITLRPAFKAFRSWPASALRATLALLFLIYPAVR